MKKKIVITGAGSAQSNATINCLLMANDDEEIIGPGADPVDLMFCHAHKRYLVPHAKQAGHKEALLKLLEIEKPDMIHFQHDLEVWKALQFRDEIESLGVKMLVPDFDTVDTCVHKYKSWLKFKEAGVTVPENIVIKDRSDLRRALSELGDESGKVWLRAKSIGNGGKGSLSVSDYEEAEKWIDRNDGWFFDTVLFDAAEDKIKSFLSECNQSFLDGVEHQTRDREAKEAVIQQLLAEKGRTFGPETGFAAYLRKLFRWAP